MSTKQRLGVASAAMLVVLAGCSGSDGTDDAATPTTTAGASDSTSTTAEEPTHDIAPDLPPAVERLEDVQFLCHDGMQVTTTVDGERSAVELWDEDRFGIIVNPDAQVTAHPEAFWFSFSAVQVGDETFVEWRDDETFDSQWYSVPSSEVDLESWSAAQFPQPLDYSCGGIVWNDHVASQWDTPTVFADPDDTDSVIVDLTEYNAAKCQALAEEVGPDFSHLGELGLGLMSCPTDVTNLGDDATDFDLRELRDAGSRLIIRTINNEVAELDLWVHHGNYGSPQRVVMEFAPGPTGIELPSDITPIDPDEFHEMTVDVLRPASEVD